eukprot:g10884.t1
MMGCTGWRIDSERERQVCVRKIAEAYGRDPPKLRCRLATVAGAGLADLVWPGFSFAAGYLPARWAMDEVVRQVEQAKPDIQELVGQLAGAGVAAGISGGGNAYSGTGAEEVLWPVFAAGIRALPLVGTAIEPAVNKLIGCDAVQWLAESGASIVARVLSREAAKKTGRTAAALLSDAVVGFLRHTVAPLFRVSAGAYGGWKAFRQQGFFPRMCKKWQTVQDPPGALGQAWAAAWREKASIGGSGCGAEAGGKPCCGCPGGERKLEGLTRVTPGPGAIAKEAMRTNWRRGASVVRSPLSAARSLSKADSQFGAKIQKALRGHRCVQERNMTSAFNIKYLTAAGDALMTPLREVRWGQIVRVVLDNGHFLASDHAVWLPPTRVAAVAAGNGSLGPLKILREDVSGEQDQPTMSSAETEELYEDELQQAFLEARTTGTGAPGSRGLDAGDGIEQHQQQRRPDLTLSAKGRTERPGPASVESLCRYHPVRPAVLYPVVAEGATNLAASSSGAVDTKAATTGATAASDVPRPLQAPESEGGGYYYTVTTLENLKRLLNTDCEEDTVCITTQKHLSYTLAMAYYMMAVAVAVSSSVPGLDVQMLTAGDGAPEPDEGCTSEDEATQ